MSKEAKNALEKNNSPASLAISVRNVSKMYPLYTDPRDRLKQSLWYALPKFLRGRPREFYREFWALRDISFDIYQGETLGIIGRNGSGKSTLLQIIAGTLTPSHGEVQVDGRVAALLELGSGFNPEFTGRENVYLNGSILGLSQEEIDAIFDDILGFADIGQFIDQPVKLYSSGMYVRLAFAVQAFVPKQVLIVDEALAVGDSAFQRKCMVALEEFRQRGGTVLLVSHDTQTVVRQCNRCILLSDGVLLAEGESKPVTDLYQKIMFSDASTAQRIVEVVKTQGIGSALSSQVGNGQPNGPAKAPVSTHSAGSAATTLESEKAKGSPTDWYDEAMLQIKEVSYSNGQAEIFDYGMFNEQHQKVNVLVTGNRYKWCYKVRFFQEAHKINFGMMLKTTDGLDVSGISSTRERVAIDRIDANSIVEVTFSIKLNLVPGVYFLNAGVDGFVNGELTYLHRRVDICMIRVLPRDSREPYGLAYLDQNFKYRYLS